jgi:hypothetical protein
MCLCVWQFLINARAILLELILETNFENYLFSFFFGKIKITRAMTLGSTQLQQK